MTHFSAASVRRTTGVLIFVACSISTAFSVQPSNLGGASLAQLDRSLVELQNAKFVTHYDATKVAEDHDKEIAIRDEFERRREEAIDFLLKQLDIINSKELRNMKGPNDLEGAMTANEPPMFLMRFAYCYMLADMYKATDSQHKAKIIDGIVSSFLLTTQGREDAESLSGALFRTGRSGAEGFMRLANSDNERNRCFASKVLSGFDNAPRIDCTASPLKRKTEITKLRTWWKANSEKVSWPDFPSFFDLPKSRS